MIWNKMRLKDFGGIYCRYLLAIALVLIIYSEGFYSVLLKINLALLKCLFFLYGASISSDSIIIGIREIQIIPACLAISGYALLICLNLLTPMTLKTRIKLFLFLFFSLFIINLARIFVLSIMFVEQASLFEAVHKFLWYFLSTIAIIGIWFASVWLFKIRHIPIYSDCKRIWNLSKEKKQ
jgi:exosortase/archaeosortase family protein